jgi:PAS domain S-box-containing protein
MREMGTDEKPPGQPVKILLVDDEPANLLALEAILADLGASLVKAHSGEEGLRLLQENEFASVLLDVQMHGLNGFETAKLIRSQQKSRHTPIIFLTAHDTDRSTIERAYALGAVDFLVKPLVPVVLRAKVTGFIELFQKTEQSRRQAEQLRLVERREFEQTLAKENARLREQREWLRVTLVSIGDAVITTDTELRVTFLNPAAQALTGWAQEEAAGAPLEQVFHIVNESTRQPVENPAMRALREGAIVGLVNHSILVGRDGTERPIDDSAAPICDETGKVFGVVLVFRDVSESRRAEEALRESQERLSMALAAAGMGTWRADLRTNTIVRDANLNRLLGLGEVVTTLPLDDCFARVHPDDRPGMVEAFNAAIKERGPCEVEVRVVLDDGTQRWIREKGKLVGGNGGQPEYMTGVTVDITPEKHAEKRVYGLLAELREADRRKNEFLATLAHELRGPLAALRNLLEIMKHADANADLIPQARSTMERQLAQMVRLIDDLLNVTRISRGKIELKRERVELASVICQAVEASRPLADSAGHDLRITLPTEPIYLNADPVWLAQVFCNLLNNACKYTDPGGRIGLIAERQGSDVVVKVEDTGIGIPPEMLPRVFEMFMQVEPTRDRSRGGLGIGLTLVRRLVEMTGGSVEAHSAGADRGSEFIVRLPAAVEVKDHSQDGPAGDGGQAARASGRRILVVDDNKDAADTLAALLRVMGNDVHAAYDGLEAVRAAAAFRPDAVLMDIGLPKLDGYEAARRIREQQRDSDILLIALTGWGHDEDKRRSQAAGFDFHLTKPVEPDSLQRLLAPLQPAPA